MENINNISPKNPFKVPDNYFNEVNKKILESTTIVGKEPLKISIYRRFRSAILVAASIAGFIIISYTAVRLLSDKQSAAQLSETLNGINTETLINDMDINTLEESVFSNATYQQAPDVNKKEIIDYLLQNNIELNDIYEQL